MPVHIVYPISGASYPIIDPDCAIKSAYFTVSFSVTCQGGPYHVKWGVDSQDLGSAMFYDQLSSQSVYKLANGSHDFWVKADSRCGEADVKFEIG